MDRTHLASVAPVGLLQCAAFLMELPLATYVATRTLAGRRITCPVIHAYITALLHQGHAYACALTPAERWTAEPQPLSSFRVYRHGVLMFEREEFSSIVEMGGSMCPMPMPIPTGLSGRAGYRSSTNGGAFYNVMALALIQVLGLPSLPTSQALPSRGAPRLWAAVRGHHKLWSLVGQEHVSGT